MLSLEALVTVVFLVVLIAASIASADTTRTEQRLRRLERGDPATAEAVRRAQAVSDYARGSFFGLDAVAMMCTPSRRSIHVGGDLDEEPETEAMPRVAGSTPATVSSDAATSTPPSDRRDAASARLSRRAVRTAQATRRRRAGIR